MNKNFRKICTKLHLWLGLPSGVVVFIVCVTGCFYAFKDEINDATQPWRFVIPQQKAVLLPSQILTTSSSVMGDRPPTAITYGEAGDAVSVDYYQPDEGISSVFINPYDGQISKTVTKTNEDFDFFSFVLNGHRRLWLPREVGSTIVGYGVLIFLTVLVSGVILWWPRNRWTPKTLRQKFTVKAPYTLRRINFCTHTIFGVYAIIPLIVLSFTGLIFGLGWFSKAVYSVTSAGKELVKYTLPQSDTSAIVVRLPIDKLYRELRAEEPSAKILYFALPTTTDGVIRVSVVHKRGSYYRTDNLFFDRHSLAPLKGTGAYAGKYKEASRADKFRRMNLDIHDGRIFGIWGKIIMFTASLIGAGLPVTGLIIWLRKHRKKGCCTKATK